MTPYPSADSFFCFIFNNQAFLSLIHVAFVSHCLAVSVSGRWLKVRRLDVSCNRLTYNDQPLSWKHFKPLCVVTFAQRSWRLRLTVESFLFLAIVHVVSAKWGALLFFVMHPAKSRRILSDSSISIFQFVLYTLYTTKQFLQKEFCCSDWPQTWI